MDYSKLPVKKMFQRRDPVYFRSSFEIPDNDMVAWAVYVRIDDVVLRLNHIDNSRGLISYDYVTSTEVPINESALADVFKTVITTNDTVPSKDWLVIQRKDDNEYIYSKHNYNF